MKRAKIMMMALALGLTMGLFPKMSWAGNVAVGIFLGIPLPVVLVEAPPMYIRPPYAYTAYPYTYVTPVPVRVYFYGFPFHHVHSHGYHYGKKSGYHGRQYTPVRGGGGQRGYGNNRQGRPSR